MAPIAIEQPASQSDVAKQPLIKPWTRPRQTSEDLDWADLPTIDLSRFDEPGGKQALARDLLDAVTRVGFWVVVGSGIDDERVLRQFSIGNTFFKEPLEEKRRFPCNFADGEYFGYRENSRWIGDTGVKENIEMVCFICVFSLLHLLSKQAHNVKDMGLTETTQLNIPKAIPAYADVGKHRVVVENYEEIAQFHRELWDKVLRKLFVLISIILELPEDYLTDAHDYDKESDDHLRYMIYNVRTQEECKWPSPG